MANILLTTFGSYGDIDPYLTLARELKVRGHTPSIATSEFYQGYVEGAGVGFRPMRPHLSPSDPETVGRIMDPRRGTEFLLREFILPAIRESYEDITSAVSGVDLIVTHPLTFAGPIVAHQRKLSWISTVLAPISFFSRFDAPALTVAPGLKRIERAIPSLAPLLASVARIVARRWAEPVHALRRELNLPRIPDPIFEGQHSPEVVLALFSKVLAKPQADWPRNVVVTGNLFPPDDPGEVDDALGRFLADGPAPVVFTLGSAAVQTAGVFFTESAEAIRRLGKRAVLLVGRSPANTPRRPLPNGVIAVTYTPYGLLFPRAAAVVHHGGIGTSMQALRAGKPALIVPFAHDQQDNAHRIEALGAARTLPLSTYRARRVATELTGLFKDPSHAARAAELGAVVRSEDGANAAADAIEAQLATCEPAG